PSLYERAYNISRYLFNQAISARQILRFRSYLDWSVESLAGKLERFLGHERIDVFLAVHQLAAGACSRIKSERRPPVVADIHGIWADEMVESGCLEVGSRQAELVREFERECLQDVDKLLVVSDELGARLSKTYSISPDRIVVIDPCIMPKVPEAR